MPGIQLIHSADPQTPTSGHYFRTDFIRASVPTFQNIAKQNKRRVQIMITTGGTVGLAEWIIDDACLSFYYLAQLQ